MNIARTVFVPFLGDFFSIRKSAQKEIDALNAFSSPSSGTFFQYSKEVRWLDANEEVFVPFLGDFFSMGETV